MPASHDPLGPDALDFWLDFKGVAADDRFSIQRVADEQGVPVTQRMVWRDVEPDRFRWEWQRLMDGGASWETRWAIHFRRR